MEFSYRFQAKKQNRRYFRVGFQTWKQKIDQIKNKMWNLNLTNCFRGGRMER